MKPSTLRGTSDVGLRADRMFTEDVRGNVLRLVRLIAPEVSAVHSNSILHSLPVRPFSIGSRAHAHASWQRERGRSTYYLPDPDGDVLSISAFRLLRFLLSGPYKSDAATLHLGTPLLNASLVILWLQDSETSFIEAMSTSLAVQSGKDWEMDRHLTECLLLVDALTSDCEANIEAFLSDENFVEYAVPLLCDLSSRSRSIPTIRIDLRDDGPTHRFNELHLGALFRTWLRFSVYSVQFAHHMANSGVFNWALNNVRPLAQRPRGR